MEQLAKLPEIRISLLQKLISERGAKPCINRDQPGTPYSSALISGVKLPYYIMDRNRKQTNICQCQHMRCRCKEAIKDVGLKRSFMLKNNKTNEAKIRRYMTEGLQRVSQTKQQLVHRVGKNYQKPHEFTHEMIARRDQYCQIQKLHDEHTSIEKRIKKIEKQLTKRLFTKYKYMQKARVNIIKEKIKKFAEAFVKANIQNAEQKHLYDRLFQQFQTLLRQNSDLGLNVKDNQAPILINKYSQKIIRTQKSQKKTKGSQAQRRKKKQKKTGSNSKKPQGQIDDQALDLITLFLRKMKKEQVEKFINKLVNSELYQFKKKLSKIQQLANFYSNQTKIICNIQQTLHQMQVKTDEVMDGTKEAKKQVIQKLLSDIEGTAQFAMRSMGRIKTQLLMKRSQKTLRILRTQQDTEAIDIDKSISENNSGKSSKYLSFYSKSSRRSTHKARLSAMRGLDDEMVLQKITTQKGAKSSLALTQQVFIRHHNLSQDQIANLIEQNPDILKTVNFSQTNFKRNCVKRRRFFEQQFSPISSQKSIIQVAFPTSSSQQKRFDSVFKAQRQKEYRKIKEKYVREELEIKQFLNLRKEDMKRGMALLRNQHLGQYIIDAGDSVLTKKMKIRKLKQVAESVGREQMVQQILAYVHLYETQCQLILRRRATNTAEKQLTYCGIEECDQANSILDNKYLNQGMKFFQLSQDYFYGECELNQTLKYRRLEPIYELQQLKTPLRYKLREQQTIMDHPLGKDRHEHQFDLLQKEMADRVQHCIEKYEQKTQTINVNNQKPVLIQNKCMKFSKKIKSLLELRKQKRSRSKQATKIMLTQNTVL